MIWSIINNNKNWSISTKEYMYLIAISLICAIAGLAAWFATGIVNDYFQSNGWVLCFVGYPVILGCFYGVLKLYNR